MPKKTDFSQNLLDPVPLVSSTYSYEIYKVRNIVTRSGRGVRGYVPSFKAPKRLKIESLLEKAGVRVSVVAPIATVIETQPCVFRLDGLPKAIRYTPDLKLTINNDPCFFEVKADKALMDADTVSRLREVVSRMSRMRKKLYFILESDVMENGLQEELEDLLRQRPAPGRYNEKLDHSLWDPHQKQEPTPELLKRWHEAQEICNDLLERVMRRDPGDLLNNV